MVKVRWKQFEREYPLRFDILVNQCLLVEVNVVVTVHPINKAKLLGDMKLLDIPLGRIINFNEMKLTDGVSRLILPGVNDQSFHATSVPSVVSCSITSEAAENGGLSPHFASLHSE